MKPLHLNLASRPFRDYRPLYAVVVTASVLIAFLMLNNIETFYRYVRETRTTRDEIARVQNQVEQERRRAEVAANQIRNMDLSTLGKQTQFVNTQLAERAFSWSELLDRLEVVLPGDVRIMSVAPSFSESGLVHLALDCEAKSANGMIVTITRFQQNPHFANPFPSNQVSTAAGYRFGMTVDYKPSIPRAVRR